MSLYYEAAAVLANADNTGGSLKSRIYKQSGRKSSPAQLFALVTESAKWSVVLKDVVEKSGLLAEEKKLSPILALLLSHDLLISKNGVAAPANHVLKLAINRHKARLSAEFTKARIARGHPTLESFKNAVTDGENKTSLAGSGKRIQHPRWVRVNTLKTTVAEQLATTFPGYERTNDLSDVLCAPASSKIYYLDGNIPNLLAFPSKVDLSKSAAYKSGHLIFQDKASCFPAYFLDIKPEDGDVIDGCAAPGNKTTHAAAIVSEQLSKNGGSGDGRKVIAFEKDKARARILSKMVKLASADDIVSIRSGHDFLATKPDADDFQHVGAIMLDPSCSGSGIVGRDDSLQMHLPDPSLGTQQGAKPKGKKRKRDQEGISVAQSSSTIKLELDETVPEETTVQDKFAERLSALSSFQLRMLCHAMRFPKVCKITYSTCSVYFEENEGVVFQALLSSVAKDRGWRILKRQDQVEGMKKWNIRGLWEDGKLQKLGMTDQERHHVLEACIRCNKGTGDGTMGFFVAALIRDEDAPSEMAASYEKCAIEVLAHVEDNEWNGFGHEEPSKEEETVVTASESGTGKKNKKRPRRQKI
ncbi:S-adenosyl-L-methionine-dependent methyltransferase [Lojkania enalia]|uniref:S-adenosyl-L-methionine-dependent methyltransferase n=1 Tax=Lojkania enalia TaxID=147567 RepID=A0A9P4JZI8_9PLEO|nr:S-adenosyl-L-methionine-dependent methyltransferase [Didymosphaeria enalia]